MKTSRRFALAIAISVACALAPYPGEAQEPELKTSALAAFKNGLAFVLKQGNAHLDAGMGNLEPVPDATLGSLWIAPNDAGVSLDQVVARRTSVLAQRNLTVLADMLLANAGKVVTVVDNNQREYTGEIVGLKQTEESRKLGDGSRSTSPAESLSNNAALSLAQSQGSPEFLLLKSDSKLLAVCFRNIERVVLPPDSTLQSPQKEEHKVLQFRVKGATDRANLTMGFLEHGLGWTPSYLVSLQDDSKAQITMQAVLVNDVEDLRNTDVFFVVGVPNFGYSNVLSPMALEQSLLEFMQTAARREDLTSRYSNALTGQMTVGGVSGGDALATTSLEATIAEALQGAQEEDLFLYGRKDVTLAQGERATYNVFSDTVNYEHLYEWNLEDQSRVDGFGNALNAAGSGSDRSRQENVWHVLRLRNTTKFPWTSAPTLVISGTKPLAQDTLSYTPKSAKSILKLTIATDIRVSHEENEVDRQRDLQRRHNYNYDQVTVEGRLTINNYKSKEVRLSIADRVRGTIESQTDDGKSEKLAEAIAVDNPLTRLTWEVTLQGGEERVIKYRYKVWLRV